MKKVILLLTVVFTFSSAFAQDLVSKKGEPYLPQTGDWAVSIDATPFLNYVGNFIGANGLNVAPTFDFLSGNRTILGKYFVNDKTAYRGGVRLGFGNTSTPILDGMSNFSTSNIGLTGGIEFRKGKTRLQAYYGGEAGISLLGGSTSFDYDNKLSSTYTNGLIDRDVKIKNGSTFGLGLRAFGGIEYFILPKVSLGGEFGWGLTLASTGEGKTTRERWDGTNIVTTETVTGAKSSTFGVDTDNLNSVFGPAGTLRLTFHF